MQWLAVGGVIRARQQLIARLILRLACIPRVGRLGGHHAGQVRAFHLANGARPGHHCLGVQVLTRRDHPAHHAVGPQMPHDGARIHLRDHRDTASFQKIVGNLCRAPVRTHLGKLARHQPFDVGAHGLRIARRSSIVPHMRIGQHHDLARVGGIGEDLLVAGQRCIEDNFTRSLDRRAVALAAKDAPVFERQYCLHCLLLRNPKRSGFNRFYQHPPAPP